MLRDYYCSSYLLYSSLVLFIMGSGCSKPASQPEKTVSTQATHTYFELLDSTQTGIAFSNSVVDGPAFNILTYRNFYNGGGVAIGDINNDGLPDLYFTANQLANRLYINKGNFEFEDITEQAGVGGSKGWCTGASMADINGDGWLDIYVCNSGNVAGGDKENELFVNNGDGTFSEKAAEYGLNNRGFSTQASFFDYDVDGDLDCYLLNNSFKDPGKIELFTSMRDKPDEMGGDKLYRNDGEKFTDITAEAGIYSSEIGFGLGAAIGDVNGDHNPDIYVSNDFWERDYLYLNKGDGTFSEELIDRIDFCSISSMGGDIADINNDGYPEIMSTDMLAADNYRLKAMSAFDPYHLENIKYRANYHYQFAQNCLHLNNGQGDFQEIAMLSGVSATDWSWGALVFDFENDGLKDIFVSNGITKDIMSMDFRDFIEDNNIYRVNSNDEATYYQALISEMPSNPLKNYAFSNANGLTFDNQAEKLGLATPSFSNGAAYGDLDNDGDYDLVVNNVNMPCFIYRNEVDKRMDHHYLKIIFEGPSKNLYGIGAEVEIEVDGKLQVLQNYNSRGFQSSIEPQLIFGLGKSQKVDRLEVTWPDKSIQVLEGINADQVLTLAHKEARESRNDIINTQQTLFTETTQSVLTGSISHKENVYNDFDHENLLLRMLSTESPRIVKGNINNDELTDFILLGAAEDPDKVFVQNASGDFIQKTVSAFDATRSFESTCGVLFDCDGDGDEDLVIGTGGNEYQRGGTYFVPRYYENDGMGNFVVKDNVLPQVVGNLGCVEAADVDQDGDIDLFLGGRIIPGNYGLPPRSFLLLNDNGKFIENTPPDLAGVGMVTDATWTDIDADGDQDLIVVGDWMDITIFINELGALSKPTPIPASNGWWSRIEPSDLDQDGDIDFVLGNWGVNSKFKASVSKPLTMYVNDFDGNGKSEFIVNWYPPLDNRAYPFATKPDLTQQLPGLKKSILTYEAYASQTYESLFATDIRQMSVPYEVNYLKSAILWNDNGVYNLAALPIEAQIAPVFGIAVDDFDQDGFTDIWLGGNFYGLKPQVGRHDASRGVLLKGTGGRVFEYVPPQQVGIQLTGEVRDAVVIHTDEGKVLLVARNNDKMLAFKPQQRDLQ